MTDEIVHLLETTWRIPYAVINRHIIPYTYNLQPRKLLHDIRNYVSDYKLLENEYFTLYNENILMTDLCSYYETPIKMTAVLMRHIKYIHRTSADVYKLVLNTYYTQYNISIFRNIRCIWGLMTPNERTKFVNAYMLSDE